MYLVKAGFIEFRGNNSIVIEYKRGVYNFSHHSAPREGAVLRIEEDPRTKHEIEVIKVLEETEERVKFLDQNYLMYEWMKVS